MIELSNSSSLTQVQQNFRQKKITLARLRPFHQEAGAVLLEWVQGNIEAQGKMLRENSGGWPPLAASTLASRRRRGRGTQIMVDSGRLRRSFRLLTEPNRAKIVNTAPYAHYHQSGKGVPRRPLFPQVAQAEKIISPIAVQFVQRSLQ